MGGLGALQAERRLGALLACCGAAALAIAWFAEHRLEMAPCALCLLERWPYRAMLVLGVAAIFLPVSLARAAGWLGFVALAASIGLALTHVGVEQHWWPDPLPQCMAPHFHAGSLSARFAAMPRFPSKPCDTPNRLIPQVPLSMASLDLLFALVISTAGSLAMRGRRQA